MLSTKHLKNISITHFILIILHVILSMDLLLDGVLNYLNILRKSTEGQVYSFSCWFLIALGCPLKPLGVGYLGNAWLAGAGIID